jgi:C-5 cytosine-specific DNA methylase
MSFPDSYIFDFSKMRVADAVRQLGNAVPPNLAYDVASPLLDVLVEKYYEDKSPAEDMEVDEKTTPGNEVQAPTDEIRGPNKENHASISANPGHPQGSKEDPITLD